MRFATTASFIGVAILMAGVMIQAAPVGTQASVPDFVERDFDVDHHKPGHHDKPGEGGKTGRPPKHGHGSGKPPGTTTTTPPHQGTPPEHGHQEGHKLGFEERDANDLFGKVKGGFGGGNHHGRRTSEQLESEERDANDLFGKVKGLFDKGKHHGPRSIARVLSRNQSFTDLDLPRLLSSSDLTEPPKRSESTERLETRVQPEKPPVTKTPVPPKAKDPPPPKRSVDQRRWVSRDDEWVLL